MDGLAYSDSVVVAASAGVLYGRVADVTRMGEWSPVCQACWWEEERVGPAVGAWFVGRNVTPDRTWEPRSVVVAAEPGREFAFQVLGDWVRWGYTFEPVQGEPAGGEPAGGEPGSGGTRVTESWAFLPGGGQVGYVERYGGEAEARLEVRKEQMCHGIRATLEAIEAAAERRGSA